MNGKTIVLLFFSSVRISTIPAFGTIMETVTQKEVGKPAAKLPTNPVCRH